MKNINETILKIILIEWEMFTAVNAGGPRASCQDDQTTFEGMRKAQFKAWPEAARKAYLKDLEGAVSAGRNLVNEKYILMMKYSEPENYEKLAPTIPTPDDTQMSLAKEISDEMLNETIELNRDFPYVSDAGRPLYSSYDVTGVTSIETYQLGELLTYSESTLRLLKDHILKLHAEGKHFAREILENTVKFYGFESLEAAEEYTKKRTEQASQQCCGGNW